MGQKAVNEYRYKATGGIMKILSTILTVTLVSFMASIACAVDFYGAAVSDKEVPTVLWKANIIGVRPIINDVRHDSPAKKAGFMKGDVIRAINNKKVEKTIELKGFTENILEVQIFRGGTEKTLKVALLSSGAEKASRGTGKKDTTPGAAPRNKPEIAAEQPKRLPMAVKAPPASAPVKYKDVIDELVEVAGHRRDFDDLFGHSYRGEFEQLMSDAFSPELAEKSFKRVLARELDRREISTVLTWYKTPVGQKIVDADSIVDFNRRTNRLIYVSTQSAPGFKERMNLSGQIERELHSAELELKLSKRIIRRIVNAIPADYPDAEKMKEKANEDLPTLEEKRKENIEKLAYNYRELSLAELTDYLKFLRSVTGRKYVAAVNEAAEEIFKKITDVIEKDFRDYVN